MNFRDSGRMNASEATIEVTHLRKLYMKDSMSFNIKKDNFEKELVELVDKLMAGVRVFQAGGQEVTDGNDLADRINRAAKASAIRLYSQFDC